MPYRVGESAHLEGDPDDVADHHEGGIDARSAPIAVHPRQPAGTYTLIEAMGVGVHYVHCIRRKL